MQKIIRSFVAMALGLSLCLATTAAEAARVDYVIHISVDALASTVLQPLVAANPGTYPNFRRLEQQSAFTYNARTDFTHTITIPDHLSMVTGRPVSQPAGQPNTVHHGVTTDFPGTTDTVHAQGNPNVPYKASVFDVAHDNGLRTSLFTSKMRLGILNTSYDAAHGAPDTTGADNGTAKIDFSMLVDNTSAAIVNTLVANMNANPYNYSFLHITEPDGALHSSGTTSAAYTTAIATTDSRLGQIFNLIDTNPILNGHTAILLTADHGGQGNSHSDATLAADYTIPMFLWGAGLPAGSDLYGAFTNRFNPGNTRPDYNAAQQPLRNGDTGNLELSLLGLPFIPGSLMQPILTPVPEPGSFVLLACGSLGLVGIARRRRGG